jgi:hypothetical protein
MVFGSNKPKPASLESGWEQDGSELHQRPVWGKRLAIGLTIISCVLYGGLFFLISDYRVQVADHISQLPIFTRIVLNIAQPFLLVFITISLSLLILFYLSAQRSSRSYKPLLVLIVVNSFFAAILLGVSFLGAN